MIIPNLPLIRNLQFIYLLLLLLLYYIDTVTENLRDCGLWSVIELKLDVRRLPRKAFFMGADLEMIPWKMESVVPALANRGLVKANESFGFAMAHQGLVGSKVWDSPYDFTMMVWGWGTDGDRYIANAVRKLRALLRTGADTLELRATGRSDAFQDIVESVEEDGSFTWGDYPWGGAVAVNVGGIELRGAVSCLKEVEDDAVAKLILGLIGAEMLELRMPEEFGD